MGVIGFIAALLRLLSEITAYMKQKKLVDMAKAQAAIEALDYANHELQEALNAGDAADVDSSDPERLRNNDDGYRRD